MPRQTLLLNTHIYAGSQFLGHGANSATYFKGKLLFATADGVFSSEGDNDGYTTEIVDGVPTQVPIPIEAYAVVPISDFGYRGQKTPRSMILAGKINGKVKVTITDEKEATREYLSQDLKNEDGIKLALRSDQRSRYFKVKIGNEEGSDFSIDSIDLNFIPGPEASK